jgi:hypothetical protein
MDMTTGIFSDIHSRPTLLNRLLYRSVKPTQNYLNLDLTGQM